MVLFFFKFLFMLNKETTMEIHVSFLGKKDILNGVRIEKEREITLKTSTSSSNEIKGAAR